MTYTSTCLQAFVAVPLGLAFLAYTLQRIMGALANAYPRVRWFRTVAGAVWGIVAATQCLTLVNALYLLNETAALSNTMGADADNLLQYALGTLLSHPLRGARFLHDACRLYSLDADVCTPANLAVFSQAFLIADSIMVVLFMILKPSPLLCKFAVGVWVYKVATLVHRCGEPAVGAIFLPPYSCQMGVITVLYFLAPYLDPIRPGKNAPFVVLYLSALCAAVHPMLT